MKVQYSKELLENAIKDSYSLSDICRKIGLRPVGSNLKTIRKKLELYGLDFETYRGPRWNKGLSDTDKVSRIKLEDILKENTNYSSDRLKKRLIKEGIKESKCEICGTSGDEVILELHHINGNHYDNRIENLQILCPNCHSKTPNYRNKNITNNSEPERLGISKKEPIKCLNCGNEFLPARSTRKFCCKKCYIEYSKSLTNSDKNILSKENIEKVLNKYNNLTDLSKHFNTSRTTIRKYLEKYDLLEDFKFKYDFHAKEVEQYDLNGNFIKLWGSITDAEESLNITSISKCCSGKRKSAGGYMWKFKKH